jgi:hypothetical protein
MIERIRKSSRKAGDDPLGDEDSDELMKAELDNLLLTWRTGGSPA